MLVCSLSLQEDDIHDKLDPAVRYLQKLGTEQLDLIFRSANWVLDIDHDMGLQVYLIQLSTPSPLGILTITMCSRVVPQIFTAEDAQLPREKVSEYLLNISPRLCAGYMEYLIGDAGEANPVFHDRLAELYLKAAQDGRSSEGAIPRISSGGFVHLHCRCLADRGAAHQKLLHFIKSSEFYNPDRLFARLPSNGEGDIDNAFQDFRADIS